MFPEPPAAGRAWVPGCRARTHRTWSVEPFYDETPSRGSPFRDRFVILISSACLMPRGADSAPLASWCAALAEPGGQPTAPVARRASPWITDDHAQLDPVVPLCQVTGLVA